MAYGQTTEILLNGAKNQQLSGRCSSLDIKLEAELAVSVVDYAGSLYYRVGNYDRDHNRMRWGENYMYSSGSNPSVCLVHKEETLYVVEVHCSGMMSSSLQYNIGRVNPNLMSIEWNNIPNAFLAYGKKPKICATQSGTIVVIYERILFNEINERILLNEIKYCVSTTAIQDGNISIAWEDSQTIPSIHGVEPDVSVTNYKLVAIFSCGKFIQEISSIVGSLDGTSIAWADRKSLCGYGHNPSISINSTMNIVAFHQVIGRRLHHKSGQLVNGQVVWYDTSASTYTLGEYPSVILTDDNKIVEMHKANFMNSMYQCEGKLEFIE